MTYSACHYAWMSRLLHINICETPWSHLQNDDCETQNAQLWMQNDTVLIIVYDISSMNLLKPSSIGTPHNVVNVAKINFEQSIWL